LCIALTSYAVAETGGYPASPSHAVTGTNPDGTPRYGREPGSRADRSNTVGRGDIGGSRDTGKGEQRK
jgi:hypothetical protein